MVGFPAGQSGAQFSLPIPLVIVWVFSMRWFTFSRDGSSSFLSAGYKLAVGFLMMEVGEMLGTLLFEMRTSSPWFPWGTLLLPSSYSVSLCPEPPWFNFLKKYSVVSHKATSGILTYLPGVGWESICLSVPYTDFSTLLPSLPSHYLRGLICEGLPIFLHGNMINV